MYVHTGQCTPRTRARVLGCAYPFAFSLWPRISSELGRNRTGRRVRFALLFHKLMRLSRSFECDVFYVSLPSVCTIILKRDRRHRCLHTAGKRKVAVINKWRLKRETAVCRHMCTVRLVWGTFDFVFTLLCVLDDFIRSINLTPTYKQIHREQRTYILYKHDLHNNFFFFNLVTQNFRSQ